MRLRDFLKSLGTRCLDLTYPAACFQCRTPLSGNHSLCETCYSRVSPLQPPFCTSCGEEYEGRIESEFECPNCRELEFAFSFARPAASEGPLLMEMLHALKYQKAVDLAAEIARITLWAFDDERLDQAKSEKWPIIPVPLFWRRQLMRHFNQAEEIARPLSKISGLPTLRALKRIRSTGTQTALTRSERLKNLKGAFTLSAIGKEWVSGRPGGAVLLDDIFTTGATTHECARILKNAGCQKVVVVTAMRS
jgi:competence protein ComFC